MHWFHVTLRVGDQAFHTEQWAGDASEALRYALGELYEEHQIPESMVTQTHCRELQHCPDCHFHQALPGQLCPTCAQGHQKMVGQYQESEAADTRYLGYGGGDVALYRDGGVKIIGLDPRTLCKHSPTGLEWGYGGSGPADLALNALHQMTGSLATAFRHYQAFKFRFVAGIDEEGGVIRRAEVDAWLRERAAEEEAEEEGI